MNTDLILLEGGHTYRYNVDRGDGWGLQSESESSVAIYENAALILDNSSDPSRAALLPLDYGWTLDLLRVISAALESKAGEIVDSGDLKAWRDNTSDPFSEGATLQVGDDGPSVYLVKTDWQSIINRLEGKG